MCIRDSCDNEVDRDYERFSCKALQGLCELFVGKTGIFDHNPKGENQQARIYRAEVVRDSDRTTSAGEAYHYLLAQAYMVRGEHNRDLILEIDAGIKNCLLYTSFEPRNPLQKAAPL